MRKSIENFACLFRESLSYWAWTIAGVGIFIHEFKLWFMEAIIANGSVRRALKLKGFIILRFYFDKNS